MLKEAKNQVKIWKEHSCLYLCPCVRVSTGVRVGRGALRGEAPRPLPQEDVGSNAGASSVVEK